MLLCYIIKFILYILIYIKNIIPIYYYLFLYLLHYPIILCCISSSLRTYSDISIFKNATLGNSY